ncbi:hypothetical protein H311_03490, partial [Anncaliia algerae PRA109]
MLDKIQLSLERTADELRNFLAKKLYTEEEVNEIIHKRKDFEYKISRENKKLTDYLRYLEFEIALEKETDMKRKHRHISSGLIEIKNTRRIISIFKSALKFKYDERLLIQFIDYLEEKECIEEMKEYFANICLLRFNDMDLWIFAGHKLFQCKEIDAGRLLLQKGLRINSTFEFYLEYFKIEFAHFQCLLNVSKEMGMEPCEFELEDGAILIILFR